MSMEEWKLKQIIKLKFEEELLSLRAEQGDEAHIKWLYDEIFEYDEKVLKLEDQLEKHKRFLGVINRASSNFYGCDFKDVKL